MLQDFITSLKYNTATQFAIAGIIFLIAVILHFLLFPVNSEFPFFTFYPATIICFYICGCRAGMVLVILSAVTGYYGFTKPLWSFEYKLDGVIPIVGYLFTSILMGYIVNISKRSKARYKALLEDQTDFVSRLKSDGTITYVNQAYADYFDIPKKSLIGSSWKPVSFPDDLTMIQNKLSELSPQNPVVTIENRIILKNENVRWAQFINRGFFDENGKLVELQSVGRDLTQTHELQDQLLRYNKEQQLMLDNELVGIVKLRDRKIIWANHAMEQITEYSRDELIGQDTTIFHFNQDSCEAFFDSFNEGIRNFGKFRAQIEWVMKGGLNRWVDLSGASLNPLLNESLWLILDISEIKKEQFKIEYISQPDFLTGLPNRSVLSLNLKQLIYQSKRNSKIVAVCYLDLDNFKPINDCYGHQAGDAVLVEVANRILKSIRIVDKVSRLGGDEFVILITELNLSKDYLPVINRVIHEIKQPFNLANGAVVHVGASVGISFLPTDSEDPGILLRIADEAMYQSKANGRNQLFEYRT